MKLSSTSGFSLIELMIVVSIIGILSIIAIPSYQNYAQRARFSEIIAVTETYKTAVSLALQQGVTLSDITNGAHGVPGEPKPTKNIASIKVDNGVITATGTDTVASATYILKPGADGSTWTVNGTCLKNGFCSNG